MILLLVLGAVTAAAPGDAKPAAVPLSAKKIPAASKPATTPVEVKKPADAPKPVAAKAVKPDAKKVLDEKELQAEIASLSHLSTKTGELETETPEQRAMRDDAVDHKVVAKPETTKSETPLKAAIFDASKLKKSIFANENFQQKVQASCAHNVNANCASKTREALFCQLLKRSKPKAAEQLCNGKASLVQISSHLRHKAPEDELAKEMTHDLEMNFNKIAPFGKEDTAKELQDHAAKTQDTLVDAVENAEVAEIKRAVFRALTRLRAATIKEFDTIARLETQAIDAYNDAHHYRAENPLAHLHEDEAPVETDKLKSFH